MKLPQFICGIAAVAAMLLYSTAPAGAVGTDLDDGGTEEFILSPESEVAGSPTLAEARSGSMRLRSMMENLGGTPGKGFVDESGKYFTGKGQIVVIIDGAINPATLCFKPQMERVG